MCLHQTVEMTISLIELGQAPSKAAIAEKGHRQSQENMTLLRKVPAIRKKVKLDAQLLTALILLRLRSWTPQSSAQSDPA